MGSGRLQLGSRARCRPLRLAGSSGLPLERQRKCSSLCFLLALEGRRGRGKHLSQGSWLSLCHCMGLGLGLGLGSGLSY
jgi:hypothetical protein